MAPVHVYGFGPSFGLPDASPFVVKVLTYLRLAGIDHKLLAGDARKAPKGKLPYIEDGGRAIADSSFIVEHLRKSYRDLDVGLSVRDRALATAVQSMMEEHFYFVILVLRWVDERGWQVISPAFGETIKKAGVPGFATPLVMSLVRKQVVKTAHQQGMGRHSIEEVEGIGIGLIDALAELAGERRYFLGDEPRSVDASVFPFVWSVLATPIPGRLQSHVRGKPNLVAYCERLAAQHFAPGSF
jgi:glutathione S-transferase